MKLTDAELESFLGANPLWKIQDGMLVRTYVFETFPLAVEFVNRVAQAAEAADHHPDIDIRYRNVTLKWVTHSAKGLTRKDTRLALECDEFSQ